MAHGHLGLKAFSHHPPGLPTCHPRYMESARHKLIKNPFPQPSPQTTCSRSRPVASTSCSHWLTRTYQASAS